MNHLPIEQLDRLIVEEDLTIKEYMELLNEIDNIKNSSDGKSDRRTN